MSEAFEAMSLTSESTVLEYRSRWRCNKSERVDLDDSGVRYGAETCSDMPARV